MGVAELVLHPDALESRGDKRKGRVRFSRAATLTTHQPGRPKQDPRGGGPAEPRRTAKPCPPVSPPPRNPPAPAQPRPRLL